VFEPTGFKVVNVVGESAYQGTLEQLAGGRTIDGGRNPDHMAALIPEPHNPYDPNAVRVVIVSGNAGHIGYLSRADAIAYRPVIDHLAAVGKLAACRASLSGGWDRGGGDRGSFGVRLFLGKPAELMAELESEPDALKPAWL
jgi:hypothetical protein